MVGVPYWATIRSKVCFRNTSSAVSPRKGSAIFCPLPFSLLIIGDSLDRIVAVHEPERLDSLFGETDSNGPTDAAAGASDNGDLPFYLHKEFASGFRNK